MRIFLFCNSQYGAPFEHAVTELAARRGVPLTVVRSARALRGRRLARRVLTRLQAWLARAGTAWRPGAPRHRLVADVNAESFARRVGPDDVGVIAGFDQIFKPALIERFATLVNVHPSILPLYRGPVPSYWCLENGERASGYTMHRVTPRIDAGEVLYQETVPVEPGDDASRLDARIASAGARAVVRYLDALLDGGSFTPARVDAHAVYREHVDYRSFPGRTA